MLKIFQHNYLTPNGDLKLIICVKGFILFVFKFAQFPPKSPTYDILKMLAESLILA